MITETRQAQIELLLIDWGYYSSKRGDYNQIAKATGQINKSPMAVGMERQEVADSGHRKRLQVYPDRVLEVVDSIVREMPDAVKAVIVARYRWSDKVSTDTKRERLGVAKQTFYDRLDRGHRIINAYFDWSMV